MRENLYIDEYIKEALKKGVQSGKQIKDMYYKDSTKKDPRDHNKTFSEAFDKLLRGDIIYIVGYDGGGKRNQNITYANLVYSLLDTEIFEIRKLIKELDSKSPKEAHNKLNSLFGRKVHIIEKESLYKWESETEKTGETPKKRDYGEIKAIFDNVISYINSNLDIKDKLTEDLVLGLSESEESNLRLHQLVIDTTGESLIYNGPSSSTAF